MLIATKIVLTNVCPAILAGYGSVGFSILGVRDER